MWYYDNHDYSTTCSYYRNINPHETLDSIFTVGRSNTVKSIKNWGEDSFAISSSKSFNYELSR